MNSKDYRNLQEAYIDVYEGDLTEEQEFKSWVTELLDEGYDLSDYTWDELYESYFDEGYKNLPRLRMARQALKKARRGFEGARTAIKSGETKDTSGGQIASQKSMKDVTQAQTIINKSLPGGHSKEKAQTKEKFNKSVGEFAKKDLELAASIRKRMVNKESYDLYDIILSHLLDEGYADTEQAAEAIMVNMSEEWRESICEGYKRFPYKKVEYKIHKKEDNPTGRGTPQSIQMGKVSRHFRGGKEIPPVEKREHSPQISKAREAENRARRTQEG